MNDLKIFSGRANPDLTQRICEYLGLPLGEISIGNFHDGETGRFNPTAPRHDHIVTGTATISHALSATTRIDLDLLHDVGHSLVPNTPSRDYHRWITGITLAHTW